MGEKISFIDLFGTELELEDEYAREQLSNESAARAEDVAVLEARMDTFTALPAGSTSGDAELMDIRVGANGVTYANAGDAVRGQINNIIENNKTTDDLKNKYFKYNLFDGDYMSPLSVLSDGSFGGSNGTVTAVVKVKPNTTYYVNRYDTGFTRYRIACSENFPVSGTQGRLVYDHFVTPGTILQTVTTGANENYISVFVSPNGEQPELSVTTFIPSEFPNYGTIIETNLVEKTDLYEVEDTINSIKLSVSDIAKFNLFSGEYIKQGMLYYGVSSSVTTAYMEVGAPNVNNRMTVAKIEGGHTYKVKVFGEHNRFRVATFEDYPAAGEQSTNLVIGDNSGAGWLLDSCTITARSDDKYIVVSLSTAEQTPNVNIIDELELDEFLPLDEFVPIDKKELPAFYFLSDFEGVFLSPSTISGGSTSDTINLVNSSPSVITDIYDALVTEMPGYVSKTTLATVGEYTIAQYDFKNMRIENNTSKPINKPKIIVTAGVHGYEQGSCWCLAQFMDLLARNTTDELLTAIKENIDFSIVPVANPYGFAHNQRKNENGIDINRNFKYGFTPGDDPTSDYYGGTTAESEIETQAIVQFLENNSDAILVLDYHNIASGYPLYYLYSDEQATLCNAVFSTLTDKWRGIYTGFPTNRLLGYCNNGTPASFAYYATHEQYNSFTLETPWTMPVVGQTQYDKPTIMTGIDVFVNTILAIIKSLT